MIKIKEFRKRNMLNQTELANLIGFGQRAVSKWENDETEPDIDTLKKLATMFNCSIDELLDYVPANKKEPKENEPKLEKGLTKKQKGLVNIIVKLNNDDLNQLIGFAYALQLKSNNQEENQNIFNT